MAEFGNLEDEDEFFEEEEGSLFDSMDSFKKEFIMRIKASEGSLQAESSPFSDDSNNYRGRYSRGACNFLSIKRKIF